MSTSKDTRGKRSAGAFLGPDMLAPVPMHTLGDEYSDRPTEPPDDREPEPDPPGLIRRMVARLERAFRRR